MVALAISKNVYNQILKFKDIQQTENKVQELAEKNTNLKAQKEEKNNPFFLEKEARDNLGYQKPGETLYVTKNVEEEQQRKKNKQENWREWLNLLFY